MTDINFILTSPYLPQGTGPVQSPLWISTDDWEHLGLAIAYKNYPNIVINSTNPLFDISFNGIGVYTSPQMGEVGIGSGFTEAIGIQPDYFYPDKLYKLKQIQWRTYAITADSRRAKVIIDKGLTEIELDIPGTSLIAIQDVSQLGLIGKVFDFYPANNLSSFRLYSLTFEKLQPINPTTKLTALYLRNIVETCINSYVGFYKIPTGNSIITTKAIAVLPDNNYGDNYPPLNTKVTNGLEVVIHKPRPEISHRLSGDGVKLYKWELFINQWDNTDLIKAVEILMDKLQDLRIRFNSPIYPNYNKELGIVPYARIAIIEKEMRTSTS